MQNFIKLTVDVFVLFCFVIVIIVVVVDDDDVFLSGMGGGGVRAMCLYVQIVIPSVFVF